MSFDRRPVQCMTPQPIISKVVLLLFSIPYTVFNNGWPRIWLQSDKTTIGTFYISCGKRTLKSTSQKKRLVITRTYKALLIQDWLHIKLHVIEKILKTSNRLLSWLLSTPLRNSDTTGLYETNMNFHFQIYVSVTNLV